MSTFPIANFSRVYAKLFYHVPSRTIALKMPVSRDWRHALFPSGNENVQNIPKFSSSFYFYFSKIFHKKNEKPSYDTIGKALRKELIMKLENIVIYCGSHFGAELSYASFAGELAEAIAKSGRTITYGGGTVVLMGIVADAAMAAGGKVIGVIPEVFILKEQAHRGITELIEVPDMVERKKIMIGSGHAFIALPGGPGTLEEFSDTISHLRIYGEGKRPPVIIANVDGFYDPLLSLINAWEEEGFMEEGDRDNIFICSSVDEIMKVISDHEI